MVSLCRSPTRRALFPAPAEAAAEVPPSQPRSSAGRRVPAGRSRRWSRPGTLPARLVLECEGGHCTRGGHRSSRGHRGRSRISGRHADAGTHSLRLAARDRARHRRCRHWRLSVRRSGFRGLCGGRSRRRAGGRWGASVGARGRTRRLRLHTPAEVVTAATRRPSPRAGMAQVQESGSCSDSHTRR